MNQILYNYNLEICNKTMVTDRNKIALKNSTNLKLTQSDWWSKSTRYVKWYKIMFFISLFLLIFFIILFFIRLYNNSQNEEISRKLTASYSISTMYSNENTNEYNSQIKNNTPFVIRNN